MYPEPTELFLIGCSIESIWTQNPIKYIDTKNQLADILTKGNFTRDEWNHLLSLFNISHFSSINSLEAMSKRTQKDSGEERVTTAKSKPMMNLVSRCSERTLDVLASPASESPEKTRYESQLLLSSQTEQHQRTWRPVEDVYSSSYSEWNVDKTWSSQEWKSDELTEERTRRPVLNAQHTDRFIVENDKMKSYTEAESEMSLESRSFLHRVNDQVRKRQNQASKDATKDSDKHSVIWWMFMSSTLRASVFMVNNYSDNLHSIKNTSHNEADVRHTWKIDNRTIRRDLWNKCTELGRLFMEVFIFGWWWRSHQALAHKRSAYFRILYYALERWTRTHNPILHGKTHWRGSKVHQNTELWTKLMVSQWNSSGISSQDSPHCSSAAKSKSSCLKWAIHQNFDVQWHLTVI